MEYSIITRDLKRVSRDSPYRLLPEGDESSIGEDWLNRSGFYKLELSFERTDEDLEKARIVREGLAILLEQKGIYGEEYFEKAILPSLSKHFDSYDSAVAILYVAGSEISKYFTEVYKRVTFDEIMEVLEFSDTYDGSLQDIIEGGSGPLRDKFTSLIPKLKLLNTLRGKNEDRSPLTNEDLQLLDDLQNADERLEYSLPYEEIYKRMRAYDKVCHYHYFTDPD